MLRRRWATALPAACAAVLASCATSTTHVITLSDVTAATAKASTYRFSATLGGPGGVPIRAAGVVDTANQASDITFSLGRQLTQEVRTIGGKRYATVPVTSGSTSTPSWLVTGVPTRARISTVPAASQFFLDVTDLVSGQFLVTPSDVLTDLKRSGSPLAAAGRSEVRGVPTRRYTTTLSMPSATVNISIDVDTEGRLRHLTLANGSTGSSGTIDIDDFGMPVSVTTPAGARSPLDFATTTSAPSAR